MSRTTDLLRTTLAVSQTEGLRPALNRVIDRWSETRRRARLEHSSIDQPLPDSVPPPTVLNLTPFAPVPRRGGTQLQLIDRLGCESESRTVCWLHPSIGGWRFEWRFGARGGQHYLPTSPLADAVTTCIQSVRAQILHVENVSGFDLDGLIRALDTPDLAVLSSHDFGLFCPRPHLIESVTGTFCSFCRDVDRCGRCLDAVGGAPPGGILKHRRLARRLFELASCLVFPSPYAMETTADLFPESSSVSIQEVIPPATNRQVPEGPWRRHPQRVAVIGGLQEHKGGALIDRLAKGLQAITSGTTELHIFGEIDRHIATSLTGGRGIRIHGYYRPGRLPRLLARFGITAAVLPSIWPETYSLVVDECLAARIPVIAFDLGAVAQRLARWGVGRRVPLSDGADGLAAALAETLRAPPQIPDLPLPTPAGAAGAHLDLYRRLMS